jgi:hypothetical protein
VLSGVTSTPGDEQTPILQPGRRQSLGADASNLSIGTHSSFDFFFLILYRYPPFFEFIFVKSENDEQMQKFAGSFIFC